eukprot:TRINITY_DN15814_c0_g1_i1.p1 TRINITY_DN15814_c0_g1~~TRINITY_DN15814_c0_g1_i1.p1  ORF type:complete len:326 (-),score=91.85 TRINITY_DN15814_c0_g1_i1:33-1010(-)
MALGNRFLLATCLLAFTLHTVSSTPARRGGKKQSAALTTCPGFPGYCSESYPGDTCLVVCARGRNNVPECQEDGTWTDVPRCIEHEPGIESQVPGVCPGVPGYCSLDNPGGLCTFECPVGPPIRSTCTPDGTWDPYPTCFGDPRETQDGCDPCPGPFGGPRNRTAEAGGGNGGGGGAGGRKSGGGGNGGNRAGNRNGGGNGGRKGGNAGGRNGIRRNGGGAGNGRGGGGGGSHPRNNGGGKRNGGSSNGGRRNGNKNNRNGGGASRNQPRANNNKNGGGSKRNGGGGGGCPGDVLEACIDVCPGFTARVFSACVSGCAKRCPGRK